VALRSSRHASERSPTGRRAHPDAGSPCG
jgi:hypothetical protein